jgi:hypothetical protein
MNEDETTTAEQAENRTPKHLQPYLFKKGVSGNPSGRPKGPSMKEWSKIYLASLNDEQRLEFLEGMPKVDIWKLAEGNPKQDVETEVKGEIKIAISEDIAKKYDITQHPETSSTE